MAERNRAQASEAREELRHIVGFSAADEIVKLDKLKSAGSITEQEYGRLRAKLVAYNVVVNACSRRRDHQDGWQRART